MDPVENPQPNTETTPETKAPDDQTSVEAGHQVPRVGGRPPLYSAELLSQAYWYLDHFNKGGEEHIPTIAGLADHLKVSRETCYAWSEDPEKEEFSDIMASVMRKQEKILVNKGLLGSFNSTVTKLMLTKHNYSDKVETDITTGGEKINELPAKDKAKLDAILDGNKTATTEQGSAPTDDGAQDQPTRAEVPSK